MPKIDPITFAVVRQKLMFIADGMQQTGVKAAFTSFMYEVMDCLFAVLDAEGDVIAESRGLFKATLNPAIRRCIDYIGRENIDPGDIIIANIPTITGNHTSDAVVFTPIFYEGKIFGYAVTKAHWIDLGAKDTYPTDATNIFEEGLRIPPIKLYRKGVLQSDIWDIIKHNSRAPELVWGDMQAQIAGCHFGVKQVTELLNKYGAETVNAIIQEMYDYSERITRLAIEKIPDGTWTADDYLDSNGIDLDKRVYVKATVTVKGSDIIVDLTGSDPEQPGPMNGLWVTTLSFVRTAIHAVTNAGIPANEGCNRPITMIAPEGCVYNASPMAPCFLCGNVSQSVKELIFRALSNALPEDIPACSGGDVVGNGFFGVDPKTNKHWGTLAPCIIGQGGDHSSDGDCYVGWANSQNIPMEILESTFPLFIERCGLVQDSGGPGQFKGGLGTRLEMRLISPATFYSFIEKCKSPHWGSQGGKPGLKNFAVVQSKEHGEFEILKTSGIPLYAGDRVVVTAGGGGGYGSPLKRDPEMVRWDVINGYVSVECARQDYGVVIDPRTFEIDLKETELLREGQS